MSTSKLQRYTSRRLYRQFGKYGLVENVYPAWLVSSKGEHLELDFFIDKLSIAVEVQGRQHLEFTPFFHTTEYAFSEQLRRDAEKKDLCDRAGIHLFYIYDKPNVETVLYEIYAQVQKQLDTQEDTWPDNGSKNLKVVFERMKTPLRRRAYERKLERKLSKFTPAEQQAHFDRAIHRLECSLNDTTTSTITPKARRRLRLITYCIEKNYAIVSNEQRNVIARATERSGQIKL